MSSLSTLERQLEDDLIRAGRPLTALGVLEATRDRLRAMGFAVSVEVQMHPPAVSLRADLSVAGDAGVTDRPSGPKSGDGT